jgi:hypothetical protein
VQVRDNHPVGHSRGPDRAKSRALHMRRNNLAFIRHSVDEQGLVLAGPNLPFGPDRFGSNLGQFGLDIGRKPAPKPAKNRLFVIERAAANWVVVPQPLGRTRVPGFFKARPLLPPGGLALHRASRLGGRLRCGSCRFTDSPPGRLFFVRLAAATARLTGLVLPLGTGGPAKA